MINKVKAKSESGITLVALIITIIILVILAAVTIKSLTNDKLVETAINSTQDYKRKQTNEMEMLVEIDEKLKETVKDLEAGITKPTDPSGPEDPDTPTPPAGYIPTQEDVGRTVVGYEPDIVTSYSTVQNGSDRSGAGEQIHNRDTSITWKIWKITDTDLHIITESATETGIELLGHNGFNNGIHLIDEICRNVYGNKSLSQKGGTYDARNLKLSDIIGANGDDTTIVSDNGYDKNPVSWVNNFVRIGHNSKRMGLTCKRI